MDGWIDGWKEGRMGGWVDGWVGGWMEWMEDKAEADSSNSHSRTIGREPKPRFPSSQSKTPWGKNSFVRIISLRGQVNIEERLSQLVLNRRHWQKQSQQRTQIEVTPGKRPRLSLLITLSL